MAEKQRWVPLESNPEVLNKYIRNLGVPNLEFVDVYGLDEEMLAMVPRPVYAVVLLFPDTDKAKAKPLGTVQKEVPESYFIKQTIGNACGTIAIIHALANNTEKKNYEVGKPIQTFLSKTGDMTPEDKANHLATDKAMGVAHEDVAQEGQTQLFEIVVPEETLDKLTEEEEKETKHPKIIIGNGPKAAPSADEKVNTHFVTFVNLKEGLYEMNGNCDGPVKHRNGISEDKLLEETVTVVKEFMARDPDEVNFTLMALVKK